MYSSQLMGNGAARSSFFHLCDEQTLPFRHVKVHNGFCNILDETQPVSNLYSASVISRRDGAGASMHITIASQASSQLMTPANSCFALRARLIAALGIDFITVQAGRLFSKHHITAIILKVGFHGQRHAQLLSEECLCRRLTQVDTHANTAALC